MMKKIFFLILAATTLAFAYSDSDLDGVEDRYDKCPNTVLTDLVDKNGCTIKSLVSPHRFSVSIGYSKAETKDTNETTLTQSVGIYYGYKDFSLAISTSSYDYENSTVTDSGMNDTTVGAYYRFYPSNTLSVQIGGGFILPTYDASHNKTDYFASGNLGYQLGVFNVFGGGTYTKINDDDIDGVVEYQNTLKTQYGLGATLFDKAYLSYYLSTSDSVYKGDPKIKTSTIFLSGYFNQHLSLSGSYTKQISGFTNDYETDVSLNYSF